MKVARGAHGQLRVLVIDDSAVARAALTMILSAPGDVRVTTAPDPLVARRKMALDWPDVIVLDLAMPRMDGHEFLLSLGPDDPPVVVCAAGAAPGTPAAARALQAGAAAVVEKPVVHASAPTALHAGEALLRAVRKVSRRTKGEVQVWDAERAGHPAPGGEHVIAIGASLGGTEALRTILSVLPADMPGLVIVQHMLEGFTAPFARALDGACAIEVREAQDGEPLRRGLALLARGNHHLEVVGGSGRFSVRSTSGPRVSGHRPSVDVLFTSVARAAGPAGIGLLLTGMGTDGAQGLLAMRLAGSRTAAQDEASSVVFGMPREASRLGAVDEVLPLSQCAAFLGRAVGKRAPPTGAVYKSRR